MQGDIMVAGRPGGSNGFRREPTLDVALSSKLSDAHRTVAPTILVARPEHELPTAGARARTRLRVRSPGLAGRALHAFPGFRPSTVS